MIMPPGSVSSTECNQILGVFENQIKLNKNETLFEFDNIKDKNEHHESSHLRTMQFKR